MGSFVVAGGGGGGGGGVGTWEKGGGWVRVGCPRKMKTFICYSFLFALKFS